MRSLKKGISLPKKKQFKQEPSTVIAQKFVFESSINIPTDSSDNGAILGKGKLGKLLLGKS